MAKKAVSRTAGPLPFDPTLLDAAEARLKAILGRGEGPAAALLRAREQAGAGGGFGFGVGGAGGQATLVGRGALVRRLVQGNPPEAIARRLRRLGVAADVAEAAAGAAAGGSPFAVTGLGTPAEVGLERIIGRSQFLGVRYLDLGRAAARAVARVEVPGGRGTALGTGSLVAPRLFLTNHHVIASPEDAARATVEFDYQDGPDGHPLARVRFRLDPSTFFLTSGLDEFDFTVVAVAESSDDGRNRPDDFGYNPLGAVEAEVIAGDSVTIVQHPNGDPKQVALRENLVLEFPGDDADFLHYQTDTAPGSSGAPVYNDQWELVALHHSGYAKRDAKGQILSTDGRPWTEAMGEQRIAWVANEGVRVKAIVDRLTNTRGLSRDQAVLRDSLVVSPRRGPVAPASAASDGSGRTTVSLVQTHQTGDGATTEDEDHTAVTPDSDAEPQPQPGGATVTLTPGPAGGAPRFQPVGNAGVWTLPLRVAVNLGEPAPGPGSATPPSS